MKKRRAQYETEWKLRDNGAGVVFFFEREGREYDSNPNAAVQKLLYQLY